MEEFDNLVTENSSEETLEEAAEKFYPPKTTDLICSPKLVRDSFIAGAKWQQEDIIEKLEMHILVNEDDWNRNPQAEFRNFIEQFKK